MAYTTHEKVRVTSGFQNRFANIDFRNEPDGSDTTFYVDNDDPEKIVPEFGTGTTVAGVSDVAVYVGLSGVVGMSRMTVSSIDVEFGSVTIDTAPDNGSSLVVSYASSPIRSYEVEEERLRAESTINQRLSICYDLPLATAPSHLTRLATELTAAHLLIRNYGTGAVDTAADGYALYEKLMGNNERLDGNDDANAIKVDWGEINLLCSAGFELYDDDGSIVPRLEAPGTAGASFTVGGRVRGRVFDITEEPFRLKPFQVDVNKDQSGSGRW